MFIMFHMLITVKMLYKCALLKVEWQLGHSKSYLSFWSLPSQQKDAGGRADDQDFRTIIDSYIYTSNTVMLLILLNLPISY